MTLDGVGVGALPDATSYGDVGANTLLHVAQSVSTLRLPCLRRLGLGNLLALPQIPPMARPNGCFGHMQEVSAGKDTTTGHWELCGLVQEIPLSTYPSGFPAAIIDEFSQATGLKPLGNIAASGTEIIRKLGTTHLATGQPIVYTSSDSVFQIAAHEDIIPPPALYEICRIARKILDRYRIGRVIARPFIGSCTADFQRTARRHDFSLPPPDNTLLDYLTQAGQPVYAIGKIADIFAGRGITYAVDSASNQEGMQQTLHALSIVNHGLIFTNLVDFDMLYGHRRDAVGFAQALGEFDCWLPQLLRSMRISDLLILTADHGCDPLAPGSDHTREKVPILVWAPAMTKGVYLGERQSFSDVGATIADFLRVECRQGISMGRQIVSTFSAASMTHDQP